MKKPLVLLVLGRPGSGKGTQAEYLSRDFDFAYVGAGKLLRERAREGDFTGRKVKRYTEEGRLVPAPVLFDVLLSRFEEVHEKNPDGVVVDGAQRNLFQAQLFDELAEWYGWDAVQVLNIEISEEETRKRLAKRGRADDDEEGIAERLRLYRQETLPVLEHYRNLGIVLEIDGEKSREEVAREIREKLSL